MSEEQIKSILNANTYLIKCKCDSKCNRKFERARKYLNLKVSSVLTTKKRKTTHHIAFSILALIFSLH